MDEAAPLTSRLHAAVVSGPLGQRNFRLLVGCDVTSMLGTSMAAVAVPFAVLASGGSVSDVGYVAAAGLIPTVAFLLFGGVLADRLPRQQVMVAANIGQGVAQGGFAVLVLTGTGFQTPQFDRVPAAHLYHAISALNRTGQGFSARMIAAEALSRT